MTEVDPPPNADFLGDGAAFFGSGFSTMGDGASSMSSSMFSAMPEVGMPDVGMPEVGMPDMEMPSMASMNPLDVDVGGSSSDSASSSWSFMPSVPDVSMPEVVMPSLSMPDMSMPDVPMGMPDMGLPDMGIPDMGMPDMGIPPMPDMGMADMGMVDMMSTETKNAEEGAVTLPVGAAVPDESSRSKDTSPVSGAPADGKEDEEEKAVTEEKNEEEAKPVVSLRGSIVGMGSAFLDAAEGVANEAAAVAASATGAQDEEEDGSPSTESSPLSPEEREEYQLQYREVAKKLGTPDALSKSAFKKLVKQVFVKTPMLPKAKDLEVAFELADKNKNGTISEAEFTNIAGLVKMGAVKGLGGGVFSSASVKKKSFRVELKKGRNSAA